MLMQSAFTSPMEKLARLSCWMLCRLKLWDKAWICTSCSAQWRARIKLSCFALISPWRVILADAWRDDVSYVINDDKYSHCCMRRDWFGVWSTWPKYNCACPAKRIEKHHMTPYCPSRIRFWKERVVVVENQCWLWSSNEFVQQLRTDQIFASNIILVKWWNWNPCTVVLWLTIAACKENLSNPRPSWWFVWHRRMIPQHWGFAMRAQLSKCTEWIQPSSLLLISCSCNNMWPLRAKQRAIVQRTLALLKPQY